MFNTQVELNVGKEIAAVTRTNANATRAPQRRPNAESQDAAVIHIAKPGDNMWDIAQKHKVSLDELMNANPKIKERDGLIFSGTQVRIPASGAQTANDAPRAAPQMAAEASTPRAPASAEVQNAARVRAAASEQNRRQNPPRSTPAATPLARGIGSNELQAAEPRSSDVRAPVNVRSTRNMTEAQKYDFYQNLVESKGGEFHRGKRARNIIGLRNETNPNANGGRGAEDDRFVMAWVDRNGNKRVREYQGTTEGNDRNRQTYSDDVNRDGRNDLGRIPNGYYEYGVSKSARLGDVLRPTKAFQVERDFNQDGRYTGRERRADTSGAFLFHKGGSAGCQTMDTSNWNRFWTDLHSAGRPQKIGYTLLNV